MDLNALLIFAKVAQCGSFAEASRQLNQPSSSVSRKVQLLEESLNTRLLHRTTRAIKLTDSGVAILAEAEQVQAAAERVKAITLSQSDTPQGRLRITAPQGFVNWPLGDWLIEFKQIYPQIEVDLITGNRFLDLQKEQLDFAFRQGPLPDSNLIAKKITDIRYGIFATPEFLSGIPSIQSPQDLINLPAICVTAQGKQLPWLLQNEEQTLALKLHGVMKVEDTGLVQKATFAGIGLGYLPLLKIEEAITQGQLLPVLEEWWPDPVGFYLVYQSKDYLPAKDRLFLEFVQQRLTQLGDAS